MSNRTGSFKFGTLAVRWRKHAEGRGRPGLVFWYPKRPDGWLLHSVMADERYRPSVSGPVFEPSFVKELEARGYDLATLEFTIRLKEPPSGDTT